MNFAFLIQFPIRHHSISIAHQIFGPLNFLVNFLTILYLFKVCNQLILVADKIGDSAIKQDMQLGQQIHFGAKSHSEETKSQKCPVP